MADESLRSESQVWEPRYTSSPAIWLGTAFLGGVLVALAASRVGNGADLEAAAEDEIDDEAAHAEQVAGFEPHVTSASVTRRVSQAGHQIRMALVNVAVAKAVDYLENVMPGFRHHFEREAS